MAKKNNGNRLLVFEPNFEDNKIPSVEDLSISVSLKTTKKARSVISLSEGVQNTGETNEINFIGGSTDKNGTYLTTNYTNASVNFDKSDPNRDLETLGIENIEINFDTAYTPKITIKFVDIRGNAIFQQGNSSKYSVFFDLPYPIFELTVKGFYGQPVTYCLHLLKWNSSFNSETGNFEIKTEFIGYTYAILTDMLLGFMRAVISTPEGEPFWKEAVKEYAEAGITLKSIDQFITDIDNLAVEFEKIKNEDNNLRQIGDAKKGVKVIDTIEDKLDYLQSFICPDSTNYFRDRDLIIVSDKEFDNQQKQIETYKKDIETLLEGEDEGYNKIVPQDLKINNNNNGTDIGVKRIITFKLKGEDISLSDEELATYIKNNVPEYKGVTDETDIADLAEEIKVACGDKVPKDTTVVIYSFIPVLDEINRVKKIYRETNSDLTKKLGNDLAEKSKESLGFDSTIKNIVRILTVHCEVFLKTLKSVSVAAESSSAREKVLKEQVLSKGKVNVKDEKIFPWPEYRKKKASKNGGFEEEESWLGDELNPGDIDKVQEVVFVEHLYEELLKVARGDENILNNLPSQGENLFYPVGPLDAPFINSNSDTNPYKTALTEENARTIAEEAIRCFFARAFLFLSVNNVSSLYTLNVEAAGAFEAENLYNVLTSGNAIEKNKADEIIGKIQNYNVDDLIGEFSEKGTTKLTYPDGSPGPVKIFERDPFDDIYHWTYIGDSTRNYLDERKELFNTDRLADPNIRGVRGFRGNTRIVLPINGNFDGKIFYNSDGKLKSNEGLINVSDGGVNFVTNLTLNRTQDKTFIEDGSKFFRIISENDYLNNSKIVPTFGQETYQKYFQANLGKLGNLYLDQQSVKTALYKATDRMNGFNMKSGLYNTAEINDIIYNSKAGSKKEEVHYIKKGSEINGLSSILCNYFFDGTNDYNYIRVGNYLCRRSFYDEDSNYDFNGKDTSEGYGKSPFPKYISYANSVKEPQLGGLPGDRLKRREIVPNNPNATYRAWTDRSQNSGQGGTSGYYRFRSKSQRENLGVLLNDSAGNDRKDSELIYTPMIEYGIGQYETLSLFGSRFYYEQSLHGRAFLFLHTFGWQGLIGDIRDGGNFEGDDVSLFSLLTYDKDDEPKDYKDFGDEDETPTLKGIFMNNGAFIKAPKLWCAFIGAILYRYDYCTYVLKNAKGFPRFYTWNGNTYIPFIPNKTNSYANSPTKNEYLYSLDQVEKQPYGIALGISNPRYGSGGGSSTGNDTVEFGQIDKSILDLPLAARREFKRIFQEFVENDFEDIRRDFELMYREATIKEIDVNGEKEKFGTIPFSFNEWKQMWGDFHSRAKLSRVKATSGGGIYTTIAELKTSDVSEVFENQTAYENSVLLNYSNVGYLRTRNNEHESPPKKAEYNYNTGNPYEFKLINKFKGPGVEKINNLYREVVYIQNGKPDIFIPENRIGKGSGGVYNYDEITVFPADLDDFTRVFLARFKELSKDWVSERAKLEDNLEQKVFNSTDDTLIKLNLYRTLSSINSKWISADKDVFNPSACGCNGYDKRIAKEERGSASKTRLIDSFRFVDRAYNNIGDDFYINPIVIRDMIIGKYNSSFFNLLNNILRNNNFTFISLPTFINYNNLKEVGDVFKPYPYKETVDKEFNNNGPSFICTYVGQTSTNLDLGEESRYPDDGIEVLKDDANNLIGLPEDFTNNKENEDGTLNIPFFLVSYGRQNQSFFKNVKLDQTEYSETAESLEIIEDLSREGMNASPAHIGQNLWNVYQKRAYTCTIEMMGDAMIQPMMYFYLDDIPMFKGAYNIYKVSHSITPHNMRTTFTGTRIKRTKTPLIDKATLFGNLLSELIITSESAQPYGSNRRVGGNKKQVKELERLNPSGNELPSKLNFIDTPINVKLIPINDSLNRNQKIDDSDGFRLQKNDVKKFGLREVCEILQITFKEFKKQAQGKNHNDMIYINDLSFNGGGVTSEHASHIIGIDIDLRQVTNEKDSGAKSITFSSKFFQTQSNAAPGVSPQLVPYKNGSLRLINPDGDNRVDIGKYSREGTKLFINTLLKYSGKTIKKSTHPDLVKDDSIIELPTVEYIWFNDPVLIEDIGVVRAQKAHDNHLHIRFKIPPRVDRESNTSDGNSRQFLGEIIT